MKQFGSIVIIAVMLWASRGYAAAGTSWSPVPLGKWTEARTLDGDVPAAPPYGAWQEQAGTLQATGLTNCWSTRLLPGDRHDVTITTRFTVQKSSGMPRVLPGGYARWGFHWGENLPGWDVGVVLGYQDPLNFYRVQLSATRGELALWDATGGFLQLVPCAVALNMPHALTIQWRGAHLTASLDDKQVMDYWDRSLPYVHGQVGLAVWKSEVQFTQFGLAGLSGRAEQMPAHVPDFHLAPVEELRVGEGGSFAGPYAGMILFDGNEPITYFYKLTEPHDDNYITDSLVQQAVKLKPGWRPAYFNYIGPDGLKYTWRWPLLVGNLPQAFTMTASGPQLVFAFQTEMPKIGRTDYQCTVTYDAPRGVYRYEFEGTLTLSAEAKVNEFELSDPLVYNNRFPGPGVIHRWNTAGYRWWLYPGTSGNWERMPLTDYPNDYDSAINNAKTPWGKESDILYPDPQACPVFENDLNWPQGRGGPWSPGQCSWGYDFHHRQVSAGTIPAGTVRSFAMIFTALPPAEAQAIFQKSQLMPCLVNDKHVLIPFNPAGMTFADTTTWIDPSSTMVWNGGTQDATTGHGDHFSLRVDGPGRAKVRLFHYMIEPNATRWWVRGWYKTAGIPAQSLQLRVAYPGWAEAEKDFGPQEHFALDSSDHDWKYFSFVTGIFKIGDESYLGIELSHLGRVWLDDLAVSALTDEQHPAVTGEALPAAAK